MKDKLKRLAASSKVANFAIYLGYIVNRRLVSLLYCVMRIFPIRNNKIVCCNTKGKNYGDNPKYIVDAMLGMTGKDYDFVWLLNREFQGELPAGIRRVNTGTLAMVYELATARVWLDSNTKSYGTLKRKNQIYVQTWHGSYGLKKICWDIEDKMSRIDKKDITWNAENIDLLLSNSRATTEIYTRALRYNGQVLEAGSPRNDIFFDAADKYTERVKKHFNVEGKQIALYAPTFRKDFGVSAFALDFERTLNALEKKFGGAWVMLVRLHPNNLSDADKFIKYSDRIINATDYSVMQELLVAADVLISDYSSCIFDFVTTGKKCFIYASDAEEYKNDRDCYFNIYELPFPVSEDNDKMETAVISFDEDEYQTKLQELFRKVGLCESGHASREAAEYIAEKMEK